MNDRQRSIIQKLAFAVTPEGHEFDAAAYNALARQQAELSDAASNYTDKAPIRAYLDSAGALAVPLALGLQHNVGAGELGPLAALANKLKSRHHDYAAQAHEQGSNAWNPFGGLLTPSRYETGERPKGTDDSSRAHHEHEEHRHHSDDSEKNSSVSLAAVAQANLANAGYTPVDVAKIAGALSAYMEAGFSLKEASEHTQVPQDVLEHALIALGTY